MFGTDQTAAALAFVAFGANFLGTALLLLFNPGSRSVRWYVLFALSQLVWLFLQGLLLSGALSEAWWGVYAMNVHMMPAFFFAAVLVQRFDPGWKHLLPIAAGIVAALIMGDHMAPPLMGVWHAAMWGLPAILYRRGTTRQVSTDVRLRTILSGIIPVAVLASILSGGQFVLFVLPLLTIGVQLLIFTGVVYHRFYDIEIRAARTSELATAAAEQDRLALLGELSATIAHEVRNPLTGVRSLTQLLADPGVDDDTRRRYTAIILEEIARLDRIVGNLTGLAKRSASAAPLTEVAVRPLFEDLVMLVEPRARRGGVTLQCGAGDVTVRTQRDALAQALLNLLLNAVAQAPEGSAVHLDARRENGATVVSVRDHGPGVPADMRQRIFEPFHTAGGVGLGLTVVRRLADEHGWRVAVTAADGGGACFHITLPGTS
jgi:signal transduction histidine kinase